MNSSQAIEAAESTFAALADIPASDAEMVKGRKCPECESRTHFESSDLSGEYRAFISCNHEYGYCNWWEEL